jgi:hypothetical protein
MFRHVLVRRFASWMSLLIVWVIALSSGSQCVFAQITVSGIADKTVYHDTATFTVVTQAGYSYSATLNGAPVPVGTAVTVTRMDYYDLWAWRTNLSSPFDVTNLLPRANHQRRTGTTEFVHHQLRFGGLRGARDQRAGRQRHTAILAGRDAEDHPAFLADRRRRGSGSDFKESCPR